MRHAFASHEESRRRHLLLLVSLVAVLLGQPFLAHRNATLTALSNLAFGLTYVYVIFVLFGGHRERWIAYALFVPLAIANLVLRGTGAHGPVAVVFHASAVAFLGYTVAMVMRDLLTRRTVSSDHVLGAVCGYLLSALAWAHLFALAYMAVPESFSVSDAIAAQLEDVHLRNALFNYLSLTTLTSIGFSDVTPVAPPAYSLVWLEVIFGQFYMAIVVAQLVGLKLTRAGDTDAS